MYLWGINIVSLILLPNHQFWYILMKTVWVACKLTIYSICFTLWIKYTDISMIYDMIQLFSSESKSEHL